MSLNGKTLLKPKWIEGRPFCRVCIGFHKEKQPLTVMVEKAEYILYACVRCDRLYRSTVKTMRALEEIQKIKVLLVEKDQKEKYLETWRLCRDINRELAEIDRKIHSV